jgi:hypothetical protein
MAIQPGCAEKMGVGLERSLLVGVSHVCLDGEGLSCQNPNHMPEELVGVDMNEVGDKISSRKQIINARKQILPPPLGIEETSSIPLLEAS